MSVPLTHDIHTDMQGTAIVKATDTKGVDFHEELAIMMTDEN